MSKGHPFSLLTLAAVMALPFPASAQSVISTHSGVIHFFEGVVYLNDQPLESRLGKYPALPQGSELRTAEGHAEVLLTPGVFLRMGDHSSVRMVSNDLGDTQVELRTGSLIVDSGEPNPDTSVTLMYSRWRVHLLQKGVYRMDSQPARLFVRDGKAEAFAVPTGAKVPVDKGSLLPFADVLVADRVSGEPAAPKSAAANLMGNDAASETAASEPMAGEPNDALSDWSKGRGQSISADDAITAQIDEDPASQTLTADAFTYYPMLGILSPTPAVGPGYSNPYLGVYTPQPGFNSIYLPGYTYLPLMLGAYGGGIRGYMSSPLRRIVISPGRPTGSYVSFPPGLRPISPTAPRPMPVIRPVVGPHVGAHR